MLGTGPTAENETVCSPRMALGYRKKKKKQVKVGFPGSSDGKESACQCRTLGFDPGSGRCPGGGHGHPLQYSYLENPVNRGAWWATSVHGVAKGQTRLSD